MSALGFNRFILQCDGCKARHGEPHGHNSAQEARIAAYIDEQHLRALGDELARDALAETRTRAGHQRHLALQSRRHGSSNRLLKGFRLFQR